MKKKPNNHNELNVAYGYVLIGVFQTTAPPSWGSPAHVLRRP